MTSRNSHRPMPKLALLTLDDSPSRVFEQKLEPLSPSL